MGMTFKETSTLSQYFKIDGKGPIDIRFAVEKVADLTNGTFSKDNSYNMLMVGVEEDNGIYVLINSSNPASTSSWQKLASASDISGLSGVFTFKGVAEAISPDQSIITTRGVITTEIKNEQQQVIKYSETLYCVTTAYEFDMDVYYGWGTSLEDIRFWTDTSTVNSGTTQYDKGGQTEITAFEFNDKLYYPTGTKGKYESIDGEVVYIADNKVYETDDFTKTSIGDAIEVTYIGYAFAEKTEKIVLEENITSKTIPAAPDNSGHVYQIGENEYASNGQIWVKLGSPVEDWIIL